MTEAAGVRRGKGETFPGNFDRFQALLKSDFEPSHGHASVLELKEILQDHRSDDPETEEPSRSHEPLPGSDGADLPAGKMRQRWVSNLEGGEEIVGLEGERFVVPAGSAFYLGDIFAGLEQSSVSFPGLSVPLMVIDPPWPS